MVQPPAAVPLPGNAPAKTNAFAIIAIVVVALLGFFVAIATPVPELPNEAQAVGYRIGRAIGMFFLPLLVAYPIAGRRKARNPNLFAGIFCGLTFLFILTTASSSFKIESTEQKLGRLMREAAGLQPVRKSFFKEAKTDTQMRSFFKDVIDVNKEYQQGVDTLDISETKKLNTPESFADPGTATEALRQLHAAYDLDARQEQRLQEVLEKFKKGLDELSPSDREDMLKGFNEGLAKAMPTRERAVTAEKAWIDSVDDVYAYAQTYHSSFVFFGGRLAVSDNRVREEFNQRIRTMNAHRTEFLEAKTTLEQMQRQNLDKIGISRQQTGLH
jgi:hypothetical protein